MNLRHTFSRLMSGTASLAVGLGIGLSAFAPAYAEEAHEAGKKGMPQFDPSHFSGQLFWLAIAFAVLYVAMARVVLPRIGRVVERRATHIAQDLELAQRDRDAMKKLSAEYDVRRNAARAEAQSIVTSAQAETARKNADELSIQSGRITADIKAAEARIASARAEALQSIAPAAVQTAATVISKFTSLTPDQGKLDSAVVSALSTHTKKDHAA